MTNLTILTHDNRWKGLGPTVRRAAEAALAGVSALRKRGPAKARLRANGNVCMTILLTNDAEVRTLNRDFRGKDKPTNVLSFPDGSEEFGEDGAPVVNLGDIALAYETITREADVQGKRLKHHVTHLTIHGVLHLLGYDHETDTEAEAMEALEIAILSSMGIANPYEAG